MPENVQQFALQAHMLPSGTLWFARLMSRRRSQEKGGGLGGAEGGLVTHFIFCDGAETAGIPVSEVQPFSPLK